jgi:hypothetical protein
LLSARVHVQHGVVPTRLIFVLLLVVIAVIAFSASRRR